MDRRLKPVDDMTLTELRAETDCLWIRGTTRHIRMEDVRLFLSVCDAKRRVLSKSDIIAYLKRVVRAWQGEVYTSRTNGVAYETYKRMYVAEERERLRLIDGIERLRQHRIRVVRNAARRRFPQRMVKHRN